MTPRTLFQIIIKIFGLFFVYTFINTLPQLFNSILYFISPNTESMGSTWALVAFVILGLAFQVFCMYMFLFNSNVLVDKLQLDQRFEDDIFNFKIPKSFVLYTAIIVIAGVILIQEIPSLILDIYYYYQRSALDYTEFSYASSIISIVKIVLAFLLVGERKFIVRLIDKDAIETEEEVVEEEGVENEKK